MLLSCDTFNVQNGEQVRFWKEVWLGDKPFSEVYPSLFRIVRHEGNMMVADSLRLCHLMCLLNNVWFLETTSSGLIYCQK